MILVLGAEQIDTSSTPKIANILLPDDDHSTHLIAAELFTELSSKAGLKNTKKIKRHFQDTQHLHCVREGSTRVELLVARGKNFHKLFVHRSLDQHVPRQKSNLSSCLDNFIAKGLFDRDMLELQRRSEGDGSPVPRNGIDVVLLVLLLTVPVTGCCESDVITNGPGDWLLQFYGGVARRGGRGQMGPSHGNILSMDIQASLSDSNHLNTNM